MYSVPVSVFAMFMGASLALSMPVMCYMLVKGMPPDNKE